MGKSADREYVENVARTLMGQLGVEHDAVGVDNYNFDPIAVRIREALFMKVFRDMRHMKLETLTRIAQCGTLGTLECQNIGQAWDRLQCGEDFCTMSHVHGWHNAWLEKVKTEKPDVVIRHMAASAVVAAMYDIVVRREKVAA